MSNWTRIPAEITGEDDRRTLAAILTSAGLEARVAKVRYTKNGTAHKFIEYREQERSIYDEQKKE